MITSEIDVRFMIWELREEALEESAAQWQDESGALDGNEYLSMPCNTSKRRGHCGGEHGLAGLLPMQ